MQPNPLYKIGVPEVRELLGRAPWMLLVSHPASGPVASPSPVLFAPDDGGDDAEPIVLETHLGRADARQHGLLQPREDGEPHRMLVVAQGEHGYVSPSWYVGGDAGQIPTWNFEMATLTCDVEVLDAQRNLETLQRLVAHFEQAYAADGGVRLDVDDDGNRGMAMGTIGIRLTVRSFDAKSKMSQNKSPQSRAAVLAHLDASNPRLADRMRTRTAEPSTDTASASAAELNGDTAPTRAAAASNDAPSTRAADPSTDAAPTRDAD
ncbi:FMN-binding negative transcriptional regulator [Agrococcus sp. ARC_14]|uniref:FMN-binding negative transcriptional regulator n=1 Tax=Agrococcus sp. ARC_14 TaxID=2919927 RepID=UPI001F056E10|nr:FMN-binding negative transcriptional regulator [Agrococcus sp. ARC_14]MCH1883741.1 FMN-binding negative transcriptional regulator [Agrococcus sp. ARC_14]